ncbi:hypothetical protein SAMN05660971_02973 [Halomonas cupida]|uniref:Uncharacterized protein n=1 Tax=Halomonas cupida TaxID=44933 RepID=A0A1M7ITB1_9GAMM|nr:hypothetical protein SAMN05660971_02973 [Halomonas cupida]
MRDGEKWQRLYPEATIWSEGRAELRAAGHEYATLEQVAPVTSDEPRVRFARACPPSRGNPLNCRFGNELLVARNSFLDAGARTARSSPLVARSWRLRSLPLELVRCHRVAALLVYLPAFAFGGQYILVLVDDLGDTLEAREPLWNIG